MHKENETKYTKTVNDLFGLGSILLEFMYFPVHEFSRAFCLFFGRNFRWLEAILCFINTFFFFFWPTDTFIIDLEHECALLVHGSLLVTGVPLNKYISNQSVRWIKIKRALNIHPNRCASMNLRIHESSAQKATFILIVYKQMNSSGNLISSNVNYQT